MTLLRIHSNIGAMIAWRWMSSAEQMMSRSIERLSSGLRINHAADDPAGLAIADRLQTQIRGLRQSMRNIEDGISVVQTAESALNEVSALLQRGRELSLQAANGVYGQDQKQSIQTEIDNLLQEVNRVADATEFNGKKLLGGSSPQAAQLLESLRTWLPNAARAVTAGYGISGDDSPLQIVLETSGTGSEPAWVTGTGAAGGKLTNLQLHINMNWVTNPTLPDGGSAPQYIDRVIAHEMTHAIMARNMDFASLPDWFREGAAEFVAGADERLKADLAAAGGAANLVSKIDTWTGTSADYSVGYAAVKFLQSKGMADGMKDVMTRLKAGDTLDQAINYATGYADTAAFLADFKGANGQAFINTLNLTDADVGAKGPGTAESVIADDPSLPLSMTHFQIIWPATTSLEKVEPITLQVGPNAGPGQTIGLPVMNTDRLSLGLTDIDVVNNASGAIGQFDKAIRAISGMRSQLGATQNRLEHTYNSAAATMENLTAAESRIRDADMAEEMMHFSKAQLLMQASTAMLAQAHNLQRDSILSLLRAL